MLHELTRRMAVEYLSEFSLCLDMFISDRRITTLQPSRWREPQKQLSRFAIDTTRRSRRSPMTYYSRDIQFLASE